MYLCLGILLLLVILCLLLTHWHRRKIIKKLQNLCMDEKCRLLNDLISPFGYSYIRSQDIFTTRIDAWQRAFGYCTLYDHVAPRLRMIFNCLPVYFDYQGRTWLIELWKGQYGINTGCEMGVYYADRILDEDEWTKTLFQCADDQHMPHLSFTLLQKNQDIAHLCCRHWWLTSFIMGYFSRPCDLVLCCAISFPNTEMSSAFIRGLIHAGFDRKEIYLCHTTVSFNFSSAGQPASGQTAGLFHRLRIGIAQYKNRFWCKIYLFVTRPFCLSADRLLYLYFYLPFAFRRILPRCKYKKHQKKKV